MYDISLSNKPLSVKDGVLIVQKGSRGHFGGLRELHHKKLKPLSVKDGVLIVQKGSRGHFGGLREFFLVIA